MAERRDKAEKGSIGAGIGRMMRSVGDLLEMVSDLAEKAEDAGGELTRSGELTGEKKGVKATYGFSVRVGGGKPQRWHFENIKREEKGPVVEPVHEPLVEVFDEVDCLRVVAELPGVEAHDIHFDVSGDILSLRAVRGDRNYQKEMLLPAMCLAQGATSSYRNGVFELRLPKAR